MTAPNVAHHNPKPDYLRRLITRAGLTQRGVARLLGISDRVMRYYLAGGSECPYTVQYCLECLPEVSRERLLPPPVFIDPNDKASVWIDPKAYLRN